MKEDYMDILLESLITGDVSSAIENQEKRGQARLVNSTVLPIRCPREDLERAGVVFGEKADDLFINVTLPDGWKKQPTDHSMWSDLVDDQGRKRGSIFYKAAVYDRDAFMSMSTRFDISVQPVNGRGDRDCKVYHAVVLDLDQVVWQSEPTREEPGWDNREDMLLWCDEKDALGKVASAWLDENHPEWRDVNAYW